jgi:hypothetical protein
VRQNAKDDNPIRKVKYFFREKTIDPSRAGQNYYLRHFVVFYNSIPFPLTYTSPEDISLNSRAHLPFHHLSYSLIEFASVRANEPIN